MPATSLPRVARDGHCPLPILTAGVEGPIGLPGAAETDLHAGVDREIVVRLKVARAEETLSKHSSRSTVRLLQRYFRPRPIGIAKSVLS